jgi:hypothetical protein
MLLITLSRILVSFVRRFPLLGVGERIISFVVCAGMLI